jgi:hypothetical protein
MRAVWLRHPIILDFITLIIFSEAGTEFQNFGPKNAKITINFGQAVGPIIGTV